MISINFKHKGVKVENLCYKFSFTNKKERTYY